MGQTMEREMVLISEVERTQAQHVAHTLSASSGLATTGAQGVTRLPREIEEAVARVITMMAQGRHVVIGTMPEELTTSVAADQLGISRPTLMKLIRTGELPSHKVGSHHRVKYTDLKAFRAKRLARQAEALETLRELEDDLDTE